MKLPSGLEAGVAAARTLHMKALEKMAGMKPLHKKIAVVLIVLLLLIIVLLSFRHKPVPVKATPITVTVDKAAEEKAAADAAAAEQVASQPTADQQAAEKIAQEKAATDKLLTDKNALCIAEGHFFETVAAFRDRRQSPQEALDNVPPEDLPLDFRKKAINLVYFDSVLKYQGGRALGVQISDICLVDPAKTFQPLQ